MWGEDFEGALPALNTPTPSPTPTRAPVSYITEAEEAYQEGQLSKAIVAYQQALNLEPNQTALYVDLARLLIFEGKAVRGAQMAREAIRRQPKNVRAWAVLGMAYDWLGLPEEAIRTCQKALDFAADDVPEAPSASALPEVYAYLAEAYIDAGNWVDANATIERALEIGEDQVDVLRNYGWVLEMQGNYGGAIEAYQEALAIHPYLVHIHMAVARNAQALGNYSMALASYKTAAEIDQDNPVALDMLGWTQLLQGDYEDAQENLELVVEIAPEFFRAYGHLGTLYFQNRNYEDAIEAFKPAIRYSEAQTRRNTVFFVLTLEPLGDVGSAPVGEEVARGEFVHPIALDSPLRAEVSSVSERTSDRSGDILSEAEGAIHGWVRLDVMNGRYVINLRGLSPAPEGRHYIGWFLPMRSPERALVHTASIEPSPTGDVELNGETGAVKGAPIEQYYTLALCYYFLDQCDQAQPYIRVALRIDPNDANARQALRLCE
jgi:tetratricopeptide (TPR) repeat protein